MLEPLETLMVGDGVAVTKLNQRVVEEEIVDYLGTQMLRKKLEYELSTGQRRISRIGKEMYPQNLVRITIDTAYCCLNVHFECSQITCTELDTIFFLREPACILSENHLAIQRCDQLPPCLPYRIPRRITIDLSSREPWSRR